jgi:ribosomal protein S18 acetylase RimI-like enzyme
VRGAADLDAARTLFRDYGDAIRVEACFAAGFDAELAGLPGIYAPPKGEILLTRDGNGAAIGCVALKPLADGAGEVKRLYVRPTIQRSGLGRALMEAVIDAARRAGYSELRLDTLPSMAAAQALYRRLGFVTIGRYNDNPAENLVFMSLTL